MAPRSPPTSGRRTVASAVAPIVAARTRVPRPRAARIVVAGTPVVAQTSLTPAGGFPWLPVAAVVPTRITQRTSGAVATMRRRIAGCMLGPVAGTPTR